MLHTAAGEPSSHTTTSGWEARDPGPWADRIVDAIKTDKTRLEPGGRSQLARLVALGPSALMDAVAKRAFSR